MTTSHHRLEDNGNGPDRVSDHILTHECLRNRKYNLWSSKSLLQIQMRMPQLWIPHHQPDRHLQLSNEIAPEDSKDPDRVSSHLNEHLHIHLHTLASSPNMMYLLLESLRFSLWPIRIQMKNRKLWNHRAAYVRDQLYCRVKKIYNIQKENKGGSGEAEWYTCCQKVKSMDSDEDDEEPQNEPATSSTSQPFVPVLPLNQRPAVSSQGPAASANSDDENRENSDECNARSQDSGRTMLYPDLFFLTKDEHWTVTPETHKVCNCRPGHSVLWLRQKENNKVFLLCQVCSDHCASEKLNSHTEFDNQTREMPERCMATCGKAAGTRAKMRSRARKKSVNIGDTRILQAVC